ncbi:MAG: hypothetical protein QOI87_157 [Bradyrhizobium sp.]|jgi:hypothetical protein|nr:hypothetical protein [Bradyrhizobium sp.]
MMMREQDCFVSPGRVQRVRAQCGPMTGSAANPESSLQTNLGIPGPARRAVPE